MKKSFKLIVSIICVFVLCVSLYGLFFYSIKGLINYISALFSPDYPDEFDAIAIRYIFLNSLAIVYFICTSALCVIFTILCWKNTICSTYEEYKAIMDKKKADKQEKKKQKLQQQLNDLDKTE